MFGLTTNEVLTRVLLYSIVSSVAAIIHLLSIYIRLRTGMGLRGDAVVMNLASALGVGSGVCLWLAFAPPAWFLRRFGDAHG